MARAPHRHRQQPGAAGKKGGLPPTEAPDYTALSGLTKTVALGPDGRRAYGWVRQAAHILPNAAQDAAPAVTPRLRGLLGAMARHRQAAGTLAPAIDQCLTVTRSSWPGLCHGDAGPPLPRTNTAREQYCGAPRSHERRAPGRQRATSARVLRGSVRLMACAATRQRAVSPEAVTPANLEAWKALRHALMSRCQSRLLQRRFCCNATASLAQLEAEVLQLSLPP
jgi:hypothetical protein